LIVARQAKDFQPKMLFRKLLARLTMALPRERPRVISLALRLPLVPPLAAPRMAGRINFRDSACSPRRIAGVLPSVLTPMKFAPVWMEHLGVRARHCRAAVRLVAVAGGDLAAMSRKT